MFEKILRYTVLAIGVSVVVFGLLISFAPDELTYKTLTEIQGIIRMPSQGGTLAVLLLALAGIGGLLGITNKDALLATALIIAAILVGAIATATIIDQQWLVSWSDNDQTLIRSVYGVAFIASGLLFLTIPSLFFFQKSAPRLAREAHA